MRLNRILPKVEPNEFEYSKQSPREGCKGMRLIPRQEVSKKIVGGQYPDVTAWRCEWDGGDAVAVGGKLRGGRNRLEQFGSGDWKKTSVFRAVQRVAEQIPGPKREELLSGYKTEAIGADGTRVRCKG
ncbi:MAG: hypothetical protein KatS3mg047_0045 [Bellilinea sp.]|nr:MAG: hypothetical protein KatS3mg047_0045 [Bellilinea sp.]